MAEFKLSEIDAITVPEKGDLLYLVDDPSGTPISKKITWDNTVPLMGTAIGILQMFPGLAGLWPGSIRGTGLADPNQLGDLSGHGLGLAAGSGVLITSSSVVGKPFSYYTFDGASYGAIDDNAIVRIRGNETIISASQRGLTLGGWFLNNNSGVTEALLTKWTTGTSSDNSYYFQKSSADEIRLLLGDTTPSNTIFASTGTIPIGTWYFAAARWSVSTHVKIWINAASNEITTSVPSLLADSTGPFAMGARHTQVTPIDFLDGNASLCFLCAATVPDNMIESFYNYTRPLFT